MALAGFGFGLFADRRPFGDDILVHPLAVFFILVGLALLALLRMVGTVALAGAAENARQVAVIIIPTRPELATFRSRLGEVVLICSPPALLRDVRWVRERRRAFT